MEQLRQFFEWARSAEPPEVIETERRFELQVGSAKLAGRVDRIDRTGPDTVAIVDYKTGKPKSQEDADESLQLSLYALAARETLGKACRPPDLPQPRKQYARVHHADRRRVGSGEVARARSVRRNRAGKVCREARISVLVLSLSQSLSGDREDRWREDPGDRQLRRRNRRLASTSGAMRASQGACGTASSYRTEQRNARAAREASLGKAATKNFGDAHRVPFVVACCRCLVLLCSSSLLSFWLPWIYSPFPFFMEFRNGVLLQLIDV